MHNRIFNDVSIEQDLGIPLSYDAAWKIFNRWPREVRVKRQRLGQKKGDAPLPHRTCRYCAQPNCTTRCPFFGLCKKDGVSAEEKLPGIISHQQAEQPRIKGLLNNLNEWYNAKCTAGVHKGTLDLKPLGPLKIKYKLPAYDINKVGYKRFPTYTWNGNNSPINPLKTKSSTHKTKSKSAINAKKTATASKATLECSSSELYNTIEKQLRNLSVSQSRLKYMSASLCRLAYAKKRTSKSKLKLKSKTGKPKSFDNALKMLDTSTDENLQNASCESPNLDSKSSKQSKSSKTSKPSKSSGKSKRSAKSRKNSDISKTSGDSKKSKNTKTSTDTSRTKRDKSTRSTNPKQQQNDNKEKTANQSPRVRIPGAIEKIPIKRIGGGAHKAYNLKDKSTETFRTVVLKKRSAADGATKTEKTAKTTADRTTGKLTKKRTIIGSNGSGGVLISGGKGACEITIDRKAVCDCQCKKKKRQPTEGITRPKVVVVSKMALSKTSIALRGKKSNSVAAIKDRLKCRR